MSLTPLMQCIFLTVCLAIFSEGAFAQWPPDSPGPRLPFSIRWNIGFKGAVINEEIEVKEHRYYTFSVAFRYADRRSGTDDFRKLEEYVGDASYHRVTKDSAGTDNPIVVPEHTEDEIEFMKRGGALVGGAYFKNHPLKSNERYHEPPPNTVLELTKAGKGIIIPIHIRIERADSDNAAPLIIDKTVQTNGFYAGGQYGLMRRIVHIPLDRGRYRIAAFVVEDVTLPEGVETVFVGSWDSRIKALPN